MPASLQSPLDIQLSKHNVKVKVGHQFVAGARREEGNREGEREREGAEGNDTRIWHRDLLESCPLLGPNIQAVQTGEDRSGAGVKQGHRPEAGKKQWTHSETHKATP